MKLFSNKRENKNELLSALAVLDGNLGSRLQDVTNVTYQMQVVGVLPLNDSVMYHCRFRLVIEADSDKDVKLYDHDLLISEDNVDDQINSCFLAVSEQLTLAGL